MKKQATLSILSLLWVGCFVVATLIPAKAATSEPFATPEQMNAKDAAVTACVAQQDIPVMGFGLKVVCVKHEHVSWIR